MPQADVLLPIIRDILFFEWDPIGVNGLGHCRDEYDSYAPSLLELIRRGADEFMIACVLTNIQRVSMGMSIVDEDLHRRIARRLVALMPRP